MHGIMAGTMGAGVLQTWDFTTHGVGFDASTPTGLSFSRASGANDSVQTGTTTLVVSTSNDYLRYGRRLDADSVGLLIEESRTNLNTLSDPLTWNLKLSCTVAAGSMTRPDGAANATLITSAAANAEHDAHKTSLGGTGGLAYTQSQWMARGGTNFIGGCNRQDAVNRFCNFDTTAGTAGASNATALITQSGAGWGRTAFKYTLTNTNGLAAGLYAAGASGGNQTYNASGTESANVYGVMLEQGAFPTELVVTTGATVARAGERLYAASAATYVIGGRLSIEIALRPKAAPSSYGAATRIWTSGSDYAEIATNGVLTISIGGVSNTTSALSWSAYDSVRIYVGAGGSSASFVSYSVNGAGASHPTITGSSLGNVTAGGALDILCSGTSSQFSAWLTALAFWRGTSKPSWA